MAIRYTSIIAVIALAALTGAARGGEVLNPYAEVEWDSVEFLHSFSHQHSVGTPQVYRDMGYRHLPFSNYYPSRPKYPLPKAFVQGYPEAIGAPNAEQHSFTDSGIHFNSLGSYYTTGSGYYPKINKSVSPIDYVFTGLHAYDPDESPWKAVHLLELGVSADKQDPALLTIHGAKQVNYKTFSPIGDGIISNLQLLETAKIYLRAESDKVQIQLKFNPATARVGTIRLMQGVNRSWRDAFRATLDGTKLDAAGHPIEGLVYQDGGGITLNHPGGRQVGPYIEMLDFDQRVLGIEVWNQHQGFGFQGDGPHMQYYEHWDSILRTGRRCFGFFVKDHYLYGRGRNVLLVPDSSKLTRKERERNALRAYRQGCFFGLLGALAVDESGKVVSPYDSSQFRFTRIKVDKHPLGVRVSVDGVNSALRPNVQIRFITEAGVVNRTNRPEAFYKFPRDRAGAVILPVYVRIEAFAYPNTHLNGRRLTPSAISAMNVYEISRIHDQMRDLVPGDRAGPTGQAPIPIVDMIFSQPILFRLGGLPKRNDGDS